MGIQSLSRRLAPALTGRNLAGACLFLLWAGCGEQSPSFSSKTNSETDSAGGGAGVVGSDSTTPNADATSAGDPAAAPATVAAASTKAAGGTGSGGSGGGSTAGGATAGSTAGGTTAGATGSGGTTAGATGSGGTTAGATGGATAGATGGSGGTTAGTTGGTTGGATTGGGLTPGQVNNLPGVPAVKVGVNFEDMGLYGDKDFNDSVLCFTGNFKVDGTSVVSTVDQDVAGAITHISSCYHDMVIHVTNPDGSKEPDITIDDAHIPDKISMHFLPGSVLDVSMKSYTQPCTTDSGAHPELAAVHDMTDPTYAHVLPNQCNTSGK